MTNTKLAAHPFAQLTTTVAEQVSGGIYPTSSKFITFGIGEDGTGPIYTTLAIGEEGGHDFTDLL